MSDSDENETHENTSYWLRIPVRTERTYEPLRLSKEPEADPAHSHLKQSSRERTLIDIPLHDIQDKTAFSPVLTEEEEGLEDIGSLEECGCILPQSPSDQPGCVPGHVASQTDWDPPGHQASFPQVADSQPGDHSTAARKSTHERKPAQMLTYESLGEPSYQQRGTVNTVWVAHTPGWERQLHHVHPHHIPYQPPYLAIPHQLSPYTSFVPYVTPTQVY